MSHTNSQNYLLLSQIFLHGLTEANRDEVRQVRELAKYIPEDIDLDQAAADHQHIFGFNVFPYESVFLDATGQLGGDVASAVARQYLEAGFEIHPSAASPDHIGHQLEFLAFLSETDSVTPAPDESLHDETASKRLSSFLDNHTLRWLPPFTLAVRRQQHPFFRAATDLMLMKVVRHRDALGGSVAALTLPQPPDLMSGDTGLRDIVEYLLTPAYCGIYLSKDDISQLAREQSMPRGFGDRRTMLLNLLRSASAYGDPSQLLSSIQRMAERWVGDYREMTSDPVIALIAASWMERAAETEDILVKMQSKLSNLD